jgi:hypothetical protein
VPSISTRPRQQGLARCPKPPTATCSQRCKTPVAPHLQRVWNYLPQINGDGGGLERYRQFNLGPAAGFRGCRPAVRRRACGLRARHPARARCRSASWRDNVAPLPLRIHAAGFGLPLSE